MSQHKFEAPIEKEIDGKIYVFRRCSECHSVRRDGDPYFNLYCQAADDRIRSVSEDISKGN